MENREHASAGFLDSLKGLGDGLIGSVQDRLELLSIELSEEKLRLLQLLVLIGAAVFAGVMALGFASITVVYLFWESARIVVLCGFTVAYTAVLVAIVIALRRHLARQPRPFAATIAELDEDRSCIRS